MILVLIEHRTRSSVVSATMDAAACAADTCEAMSQDDAAQVRRAYQVWNESGPAAVIEQFWAEDGVYREGPGWPDAGVFRGRDAALERMQSLVDLVGPIRVEIDDLIELDDGRLVACVSNVAQPPGSETPYTQSFAVVHRLRDGLIVEADYYLDRAAALDAAGLRE
jgi:ketosteroid isomerase-like protein